MYMFTQVLEKIYKKNGNTYPCKISTVTVLNATYRASYKRCVPAAGNIPNAISKCDINEMLDLHS